MWAISNIPQHVGSIVDDVVVFVLAVFTHSPTCCRTSSHLSCIRAHAIRTWSISVVHNLGQIFAHCSALCRNYWRRRRSCCVFGTSFCARIARGGAEMADADLPDLEDLLSKAEGVLLRPPPQKRRAKRDPAVARRRALRSWWRRFVGESSRRQLNTQMQQFNRSGSARTADHLMPVAGRPYRRVAGKGRWKVWTPEAVLKAAFADPGASQRQLQQVMGSGSGKHGSSCRQVVAQCIAERQAQGLKRQRSLSCESPRLAYMTHVMFDETKLPLEMPRLGFRVYSTLTSHAQICAIAADGSEFDEDVIRSPKVLRAASASCTWSALTDPKDAAGLRPGTDGWPQAEFTATLVSCDSSAVNRLVVKKLGGHHRGAAFRHAFLVFAAQNRSCRR